MAMFYATKNKEGEEVLINADLIFAYQRKGKTTIAYAITGFAMELGVSIDEIQKDLDEAD